MKKLSGWIVLLAAVGVLFATNPDEGKFTDWALNRVTENIGEQPAAKDGWEQMGQALAMAAAPGMIRSVNRREDWLLFSLYHGQGLWKGALILGVGGKFIGLKNSDPQPA